MEKYEIFTTLVNAITEVSPETSEVLTVQNGNTESQDLFFVDLGINSIDYAEITNIVMEKLNISHSLDIFTCTNRLNDVVDIFYELTSSSSPSLSQFKH